MAPPATKVAPQDDPANGAPHGGEVSPAGAVGLTPGVSFDGLDRATWGAGVPPDPTGDVGPNQYIQAVNTSVGIYSKSGAQLAAFTFDALWASASTGTACDTSNEGDPLVVYDQQADRWFLADFAFAGAGTTPPFYECIAVSKTGDPVAGGWWFYPIRTDDATHPWFADYPKMGIWPDGLYMSANMFDSTSAFREVRAWAFNRQDLEAGDPVRMVIVDLNTTTYFSLQPSNLRGTAPPAGRENFFIAESQTLFAFHVFKFHVDYSGAGSTFSGPTNVSQTSYTVAPTTVPSPGNSLDSLQERVMQWAQYRNIGGTESLWVEHTVRTGASPAPAGIQWSQINVTGGTVVSPPVQQQIYGNLGADGIHRWMGSLAVDKDGDMALGYSASSATVNPDIRYSGRLATDAANTLNAGELSALGGVTRGTQTGTCGSGTCIRWGDYTSMAIDPDGCTFWYTNEYYETSGVSWKTRIASFAFPSCTPTSVTPTLSIGDVSHGEGDSGTTTYQFTVSLSAPNPSGVTVDYKTTDDTATTADSDYTGISTTQLSFGPTDTSKQVTVDVAGDRKYEPDEAFRVDLSNASGATILDGTGVGTIANDDSLPTISIDDVSHSEGDSGTTPFSFHVTLSNPSSQTVTVDYQTTDGSATTADSDYTGISTTGLTFTPGQTSKSVDVSVHGDTDVEGDETFTVDLSAPVNATIADGSGLGTIQNDDAATTADVFSVNDQTASESGGTITFTITKSGSNGTPTSVHYSTSNGSAHAGSDYVATSGTATFGPSDTAVNVVVTLIDDAQLEPTQRFFLNLSSPSGATIGDRRGIGTITDTDPAWAFAWRAPTLAPPATNNGAAGTRVRITFDLGGDQGLNVFASGWPMSQRYDCSTRALIARSQWHTRPFGKRGLTYDSAAGVYQYDWKTRPAWAGTCRQFQIRLADGSYHFAQIKFLRQPAPAAAAVTARSRRLLFG